MKVLLAYNGFEHSRSALEETARVAREGGADVTVLSVVPPDARGSKAGGHVGMAPHADDDVARAHAYLREHQIESEMKTRHGDPAEQILEEARTGDYELIVTGTRGHGPIARLLMGSVSHKVAEHAPCTVLIVSEDRRVRVEPRVFVEPRVPA
jgi:nucleotide-binding universal stress UspA family protein